jgi:nicotinate-nucleotide adenylyltransferase
VTNAVSCPRASSAAASFGVATEQDVSDRDKSNHDASKRLRAAAFKMPPHGPGLRVGLFGGSFNPPHSAHRAASLYALKRLRLDHIWWLVTPGNPLKENRGLPPIEQRLAAASLVARHPRIRVTGIDATLNTRYTADTIAALVRRCPGTRFIWIMGADNLPAFHRWRNWRDIVTRLPIAVVDRASSDLRINAGLSFQALAFARIHEFEATGLADHAPPAWVYLHGLKLPLSSTALRAKLRQRAG